MKVKFIYFSWIRERLNKPDESLDVPANVKTVTDLLSHLSTLGEEYADVLRTPEIIRVAINQEHVLHSEPIENAKEIALFPPMTGG